MIRARFTSIGGVGEALIKGSLALEQAARRFVKLCNIKGIVQVFHVSDFEAPSQLCCEQAILNLQGQVRQQFLYASSVLEKVHKLNASFAQSMCHMLVQELYSKYLAPNNNNNLGYWNPQDTVMVEADADAGEEESEESDITVMDWVSCSCS